MHPRTGAAQTIPAQVAQTSPATYISSGNAAFFICAGDADGNIPYTQILISYTAFLPVKGSDTFLLCPRIEILIDLSSQLQPFNWGRLWLIQIKNRT